MGLLKPFHTCSARSRPEPHRVCMCCCPTATVDHIELRYSTKCYSPPPTLSLLLTNLSSTPVIPLTTTTTTPLYLLAVKREKSKETSKSFWGGVYSTKLRLEGWGRLGPESTYLYAWKDTQKSLANDCTLSKDWLHVCDHLCLLDGFRIASRGELPSDSLVSSRNMIDIYPSV